MSALGFASPLVLAALLALPLIWYLLKLTPPKPMVEVFPPLAILAKILRREETPAQSPWWLTLLRMLLAATIVLAMAGPVLNPKQAGLSTAGPLLLVVDNSWAAANDWPERLSAAGQLLDEAEAANLPVSLVLTASDRPDATPQAVAEARAQLTAAKVEPVAANRAPLKTVLAEGLGSTRPGTLAYLTDGIGTGEKDATLATLSALGPSEIRLLSGKDEAAVAVTAVRNLTAGMEVTASRLSTVPLELPVTAYDRQGRSIASDVIRFSGGERQAKAILPAPLELRNEFARISVGALANAGSVHLLDEGAKRRRVGLIGGDADKSERPLLSPVYYIRRALSPFADLYEPKDAALDKAVTELLAAKPSAIIMADIGKMPPDAVTALKGWVEGGGTLIRFAGPQLAAASASDPFATVPLRQGERALGGVLSWSEPQMLAPLPQDGPFAGLDQPTDVHIRRQVLAEPSPDLAAQTLASLEDGTPLITKRETGRGQIVLFHVSAEPSWSDLPLSGHFVALLRQLVQLSRATVNTAGNGKAEPLPPYRLLSADGVLVAPSGAAQPLNPARDGSGIATLAHPPGLYGSEDGYVAHNLLPPGSTLQPLNSAVPAGVTISRQSILGEKPVDLTPSLLALGVVLLLLDGLAVLWLNGLFARLRQVTAVLLATALVSGLVLVPRPLLADDGKPGDDLLLQRLDTTHLAYVMTGEQTVDDISRAGLYGLTEFLTYRTALEPGAPQGVDLAKDELSVFPLIYWPVSAAAPMPDQKAISRIGAYMRSGGTVLFDTRDQSEQGLTGDAVTPNGERLRQILADLDVPPLEPVPRGHVLTRSFYLMNDFPGRYAGGPLWVEAGQGTNRTSDAAPVSADGVSPILITANDLAGAWAIDETGTPLLPTVPPDETQREHAYRTGVNIMMYMLTGNYKGDQVHVPALLERLGQ